MGKRKLTRTTAGKPARKKKSQWVYWAVAGAAVLLIGGGITYYALWGQQAGGLGRAGSPAPDFTLRLLNGQSLTLSSLKGKPVLLSFWASG
jgi:cytochrome oxidase Cu insertion factor (SCO1/SenC/PrrC family)